MQYPANEFGKALELKEVTNENVEDLGSLPDIAGLDNPFGQEHNVISCSKIKVHVG